VVGLVVVSDSRASAVESVAWALDLPAAAVRRRLTDAWADPRRAPARAVSG
jgi:hypothetical protein